MINIGESIINEVTCLTTKNYWKIISHNKDKLDILFEG
jgi:hypothetical protein